MPIIDLMVKLVRSSIDFHCHTYLLFWCFLQSLNTPHFAKVKDFINLQMPSGFPIKFGK